MLYRVKTRGSLYCYSGLKLTPDLLQTVDDYHLMQRTAEGIPILEGERDNLIANLSKLATVRQIHAYS